MGIELFSFERWSSYYGQCMYLFFRDIHTTGEFNPRLHSLLGDSITRKCLQNSLHPHRNVGDGQNRDENEDEEIGEELESRVVLAESSSENLNVFFNENIRQDFETNELALSY